MIVLNILWIVSFFTCFLFFQKVEWNDPRHNNWGIWVNLAVASVPVWNLFFAFMLWRRSKGD